MKLSDALTCVFKNPRWENVPSCISSASKIRRPNISCSSKRKWVCFCSKQGLSKWVEKMPLQAIFKNTRQRMWPERSQLTGRGRRVRQTRAKEASATALPGAGGLPTEPQSTGKGGPASRGRSRPGCSSWRGKGGCRGPPCSSGVSSVTPALIQHVAFTNLGQTQAPWSRGFLHNLVLERQVRGGDGGSCSSPRGCGEGGCGGQRGAECGLTSLVSSQPRFQSEDSRIRGADAVPSSRDTHISAFPLGLRRGLWADHSQAGWGPLQRRKTPRSRLTR